MAPSAARLREIIARVAGKWTLQAPAALEEHGWQRFTRIAQVGPAGGQAICRPRDTPIASTRHVAQAA